MIGHMDSETRALLRAFYNGTRTDVRDRTCKVVLLGGMDFEGRIMHPGVNPARESVQFEVASSSGRVFHLEWLARSGGVVVLDSVTRQPNHSGVNFQII